MRHVLVMLYKDILDFHKNAMQCFKQLSKFSEMIVSGNVRFKWDTDWKSFFKALWIAFTPDINNIASNLRRHKSLIEGGVSIKVFEEIQNIRQFAIIAFEKQIKDQAVRHRDEVQTWLCAFDCETQQQDHRETRKVCKDPGRWLIDDPEFDKWFSSEYCSNPLLWLNGIPGAGMTFIRTQNKRHVYSQKLKARRYLHP